MLANWENPTTFSLPAHLAPLLWGPLPSLCCSYYAWKELRKRSYCHFKTSNM